MNHVLRHFFGCIALSVAFSSVGFSQVAVSGSAPAASAKALKTLNLAEYGQWKRVTSTVISPDGGWMTFTYQPNEGDGTLHVRALDGNGDHTVSVGAAPAGGGGGGGFGGGGANNPVFSDDSRFVAYYVNPPSRSGARGSAEGGNPPGAARQGAPAARPPARRLELMEVATGGVFSVPNAASFSFAEGGKWVAIRLNRTPGDTTRAGADLILRNLATGETSNIGNVNLYAFDPAGRLFAYTVDAADKLGNGIYLKDLASGETRPLSGETADYDQLAWGPDDGTLAVLKGKRPAGQRQRENTILAWTGLGTPRVAAVVYDPSKDATFPKQTVVSEFTALRWTSDGARITLGLREQEAEPAKSGEAQANVDVWHWKDSEPQSVQMVRLNQQRRATLAAVLHVRTNRLVPLADSVMRTVAPTADARWGIGRVDSSYRGEVSWGGSRADYYRVNTENGERTLIARALTRTMGTSPDSRWFLYLEKGHVMAYSLEAGKVSDICEAGPINFVDVDDDHPYEKPTYGVAGWSKDGRYVLLNHRYDVYAVPLAGGRTLNLTAGAGDRDSIRFRLARLDRRGGGGGPGGNFGAGANAAEDDGVDLTKPLVFSAYGEWSKKSGYFQVDAPGRAPEALIWEDRNVGQVQKAKGADRVIFTQQTFNQFPDWWVAPASFASPRKVTDANPQLSEYAWGSKKLIEYTNSKGQKLQGTLTLPANYEPGKKYPMLVYFYEIMSNTHHNFSMPTFDDRPHMSTYASDGYIVLQPDVVYEIGRPGSSALDCVTSAVKKVIELGYADPARIGLQGHSWGGYQSSFILTQTDLFAAVVTGAPPTNLVSFYNELYKSTGTVQQGIMELGQVRMGANVTPWNSHELYESQSPLHNAPNIKTPFLILHGTDDGAVDWHQGLEFFNAARRLGKEVILLSYPGEPHHLARRENQKDFQVRMKQFFDVYLKGATAPSWMKDGVPQVRKGASPVQ